MANLSEFQSLLEALYAHQLSKPMEGQLDEPPVALAAIQHPAINPDGSLDWSQSTPDTDEKAAARIIWNKKYSAAKPYDGQSIYRMNHGLSHAIRTMAYVEPVINYLKYWGNDSLKAFANGIDEHALQKLMLVAAFISIARDSEIDFGTQPGAHHHYRQKAVACFMDYYNKKDELPTEIKSLFDLFESAKELAQYTEALTVLGDDRNESDIHVVLNICHKLDLYRCREPGTANTSVDKYIREHSQGHYGEGISALTEWAKVSIEVTGNQVKTKGLDYVLDEYLPCNSLPAHSIKALDQVPQPHFTDTHTAEANPLASPFFFKSIRADAADYWEDYINWVTPSPLNCVPHKALRDGDKGAFTVKMQKTAEGRLEWQVIERAQDKPMYTAEEKAGFAKQSSLSYADPLHGYEPPVFGHNRYRAELLVGIRLEADDVLINRIMQYDMGTVDRPFEFSSKKEAEDFLAEKLKSGTYCHSLSELTQNSQTQKHNEILGRVKKISAIVIFSDNLASRILAQLRAKQYQVRLNEQQRELGLPVDPDAVMPIVFYLPKDEENHAKHHRAYDVSDQATDLEAAKNDPECTAYLEKLEALNTATPETHQFTQKYNIQPVHALAARGDLQALEALLAQDSDAIYTRDARGMTAAHYAAFNHQVETLACLFEAGADLNLANQAGERPYVKQNQRKYYFTGNPLINAVLFKKLTDQTVSDTELLALLPENIAQLQALLVALTPDEIQIISDKLPLIITSTGVLEGVLRCLNSSQRGAVCESLKTQLPDMIKSADDFKRVLDYLTLEQCTAVCKSIKLSNMIKSAAHVRLILLRLTPLQCRAVCESLKLQLPNIIESAYDFWCVLDDLTPEQCTAVCEPLEDRLPKIIQSVDDFMLLVFELSAEKREAVCKSLKHHLPQLIQSAADFMDVLRYLSPEQCIAVYESVKPQLPDMIKSADDFKRVLLRLTPLQCRAVCESLKPQLLNIIQSPADFKRVLKPLDSRQRQAAFWPILARHGLLWLKQENKALSLEVIQSAGLSPALQHGFEAWLKSDEKMTVEGVEAGELDVGKMMSFIFPDQPKEGGKDLPASQYKLKLQSLKAPTSTTNHNEVRDMLYQSLAQLPEDVSEETVGRMLTCIDAIEISMRSTEPRLSSPSC